LKSSSYVTKNSPWYNAGYTSEPAFIKKLGKESGSVSRVLFPAAIGYRAAAIYLDQLLPVGSPDEAGSDLPAVDARAGHQLLGLAGGGVCPAGAVTGTAVRSYRTISPLPVPPVGPSAVSFLWHFPAGRPGWPLTTTVPCPARTFLFAPVLSFLWL